MEDSRQLTLAECNERFRRDALPHSYGTDEEKAQAKKTDKAAEGEALRLIKEKRATDTNHVNAMLHRQFVATKEAQGEALPGPTAEELAAAAALAALTGGAPSI